MARGPHSGKRLRLAFGSGSLSRCQTRDTAWGRFVEQLHEPPRSSETLSQYLRLSPDEQSRLKAMPGWVVGGPCLTNNRSADTITERHLLSFDIDAGHWRILADVMDGLSPICDYEWVLHTTRKHTPEKPRWRLYALLDEPVTRELYEPITRILSALIDPSLNAIDPVSFRHSQLMYLPTLSRDSEYAYRHNKGKLLDANQVLEDFDKDWRDFSNLPFSAERQQAYRRSPKSEDPLSKRGIIGAFCRAYSVDEVIEKFIPEVYQPGDQSGSNPRYTYAQGEGANGAILYDDGLFLYSNHASDPAGGRNANAFDLCRIHLFGELDSETDTAKTGPNNWPSFKAASDWARKHKPVTAQLLAEKVDIESLFEDAPEDQDPADDHHPDIVRDDVEDLFESSFERPWQELYEARPTQLPGKEKKQKAKNLVGRLEITDKGDIKQTVKNITEILMWDPRFWGKIAKNGFNARVVVRKNIYWGLSEYLRDWRVQDRINGDEWRDSLDAALRIVIEGEAPAKSDGDGGDSLTERKRIGYGVRMTERDLRDAVSSVADAWTFHPILEYLSGLEWDGRPRIDSFVPTYFDVDDTPYGRETAKLFFIACVTRVHAPGHKWDFVPILSGKQGIQKSTFVKTLFSRDWAGELTAEMASNKDAVEQMLGKWALELPELKSLRLSEVRQVKEFITIEVDRVRLAYDRRMAQFPRQCVFIGTTNEYAYLRDPTGNRRFWPWPTGDRDLDTPRLAEERDQLWAEAYLLWQQMCSAHGTATRLPLFLGEDARREAEAHQDAAREESSSTHILGRIEAWLNRPVPLSRLQDPTDQFEDDGQPLVLRVFTCAPEAYCGSHNLTPAEFSRNRSAETAIGIAMGELSGWVRGDKRRLFGEWGRSREYIREDATKEDLARGYRIVDPGASDLF